MAVSRSSPEDIRDEFQHILDLDDSEDYNSEQPVSRERDQKEKFEETESEFEDVRMRLRTLKVA
jgi:hypothetical protein